MRKNGLAKEMCQDCGKVFMGGPNAFFCPACKKRRLSESAKKRNLNKIGQESRKIKEESK